MRFEIHPPYALSEPGKRNINEDCVFPEIGNGLPLDQDLTFLVCDGVGGEAKGEEASRITCSVIGNYINGIEKFCVTM